MTLMWALDASGVKVYQTFVRVLKNILVVLAGKGPDRPTGSGVSATTATAATAGVPGDDEHLNGSGGGRKLRGTEPRRIRVLTTHRNKPFQSSFV